MQVDDKEHVIVQHHHGDLGTFVEVGLRNEGGDTQHAVDLQNSDHVQVPGRRHRIVEEREHIDPETDRLYVTFHDRLVLPALLSKRVQKCRAQIDEDVSNVQRKSEEIKRSVERIKNRGMHGDAHGDECNGVHRHEDDEVTPPDAPLVRAGHDILALPAAFLARPLTLLLQQILQVVDHHDNGRFADQFFEFIKLLATDGLLEIRFSLFTA